MGRECFYEKEMEEKGPWGVLGNYEQGDACVCFDGNPIFTKTGKEIIINGEMAETLIDLHNDAIYDLIWVALHVLRNVCYGIPIERRLPFGFDTFQKDDSFELNIKTNKWQPIETAPRDGTAILVYGGHELTSICVSYYDCDKYSKSPIPHFVSRWTANRKYLSQNPPTHWMPLPEKPEAPAASEICKACGDTHGDGMQCPSLTSK